MRRLILIPLLIVVAVLAIASGVFYYFYQNYLYYRTDDAQVSAPLLSLSAPTAGQLTTLSVKQGDKVTAGQTIATITPAASAGTTTRPTPIDITSPINGTVLQTPAIQGQAVAPGLQIVQLTNLNELKLTAYIDESAISNIKQDQDVDIQIDAYKDTTFTGKVQQIVQATAGSFSLLPTQDNTSSNFTKVGQRIPVVISLESNGGKNILPGMSAEVSIHIH